MAVTAAIAAVSSTHVVAAKPAHVTATAVATTAVAATTAMGESCRTRGCRGGDAKGQQGPAATCHETLNR
jgi:hypothetical protein